MHHRESRVMRRALIRLLRSHLLPQPGFCRVARVSAEVGNTRRRGLEKVFVTLSCALLAIAPVRAGTIFINPFMSFAALTATALGSGSSTTNNTTVSVTTSTAVLAGESIVVLAGVGGAQTYDSYSDSATNTYILRRSSLRTTLGMSR
jgi:hypothetical protein